MSKVLHKEIPLYPTLFTVDVWVSNNQDELAKCFHKRYGASIEYYKEKTDADQVVSLTATNESEKNGHKCIVMNISEFNDSVIVHEINHVIHHLSEYTGIETTYEAQEWCSYMQEYLFDRIKNDGSFNPYVVN